MSLIGKLAPNHLAGRLLGKKTMQYYDSDTTSGPPPPPTEIFFAPLTFTAVPTTAASPTPTFARTTVAYVTDNIGVLSQALIGEVRFQGARRLQNLAPFSQAPQNAAWSKTATVTGNVVIAPDTTLTGATIGLSGSRFYVGQDYLSGGIGTLLIGRTFTYSIYAKSSASGGATAFWMSFYAASLGGYVAAGSVRQTLTASWQRFSVTAVGGTTSDQSILFGRVDGSSSSGPDDPTCAGNMDIWGYQLEINPVVSANYVPTSVLPGPAFNGAMVDGVQYFGTAADGVTPIPANTLRGYLSEGSRTNTCLQSQNIIPSVSWNPINIAVVSNNANAPDGTLTADTITASGSVGNKNFNQNNNTTFPSGTPFAFSAYVLPGTCKFFLLNYGGASQEFVSQVFDLSAGGVLGQSLVGSTSGTLTSASILALAGGWFRITLVGQITSVAPRFIVLGHALAASGNTFDALGQITNSAANLTSVWWGVQLEAASFVSSYITTTTAGVTRTADSLSYPAANTPPSATGSCYLELTNAAQLATATYLLASNAGYEMLGRNVTNQTYITDSVGDKVGQALPVSATPQKVATAWTAASVSFALTGVTTSVVKSAFAAIGANQSVGNFVGTNAFAPIKNVKLWNVTLTDPQLVTLTT